MNLRGCEVLDADGVHEDGWCRPTIRLRIGARTSALSLRLLVWIPEGGPEAVEFKVKIGPRRLFQRSQRFRAPTGRPTPLNIATDVRAGDEISLLVATPHRVRKANDDQRELAFMLQEIAVGRTNG